MIKKAVDDNSRALAGQAAKQLYAEWAAANKPSVPASTAIPNDYDRTNLNQACQYGNIADLQSLINQHVDLNANDGLALGWAAFNGHIEVAQLLLDNGALLHARSDYAVRFAAEGGRLEMVRFLMDRGADIHAEKEYALLKAAKNKHHKIVDLLVEHGAPVEKLPLFERESYETYRQEQMRMDKNVRQSLAEVFKASIWAGHSNEMAALWEQIPEPLQSKLDFQHALAQAKTQNLKQSKARIVLVR